MTTKVTRADLVAQVLKRNPGFKFNKKKHTIAVLEGLLAVKKSRMQPGIRKATGPVQVPGADTKRMVILKAMNKGATIEGLRKILLTSDGKPWSRPSVTGALLTDVRAIGFPYEVMADGETLQLRPPKGVEI